MMCGIFWAFFFKKKERWKNKNWTTKAQIELLTGASFSEISSERNFHTIGVVQTWNITSLEAEADGNMSSWPHQTTLGPSVQTQTKSTCDQTPWKNG